MRVLLVNPNDATQMGYSSPPVGLAYLAGTLLSNGFDVKISDGFIVNEDGIKQAIVEYRPEIVGITCYTPGRMNALRIAEYAKNINKNTSVIMGGPHPTIMWKQILENYPYVDICVLGEGEQTLLEIAGEKPLPDVDGIAWRSEGQIIKNKPRKYYEDLDTVPFPAWNSLELHQYPSIGNGIYNGVDIATVTRVSVVFSRGCSGSCNFCSSWWIWKNHRVRSAKNMVDEMELLYNEYNIRHFAFADDEFSEDMEATKALCREIIKRDLKIAWHSTSRVDKVDDELLELMKSAGCYEISFGVESGSQEILDIIGKGTTVEQNKLAIRKTIEHGIRALPLMIIGNVGETKRSVNETIDFLLELNIKEFGALGGLWILPGTKVYQQSKKQGILKDDYWLKDLPTPYYYKELSRKTIDKYHYALTAKVHLGTFAFWMAYSPVAKFFRKFGVKIKPLHYIYKKIKFLFTKKI